MRAGARCSSLTGEVVHDAPVVLVCDQLEQLRSGTTAPAERAAFLDTVLGLIEDGVVIRCVLIVRGDHVGRMAEHGDMAEPMIGSFLLVPPLSEPGLREVVEQPANVAGLHVEPELIDTAAAEVLGRSGALPLLHGSHRDMGATARQHPLARGLPGQWWRCGSCSPVRGRKGWPSSTLLRRTGPFVNQVLVGETPARPSADRGWPRPGSASTSTRTGRTPPTR